MGQYPIQLLTTLIILRKIRGEHEGEQDEALSGAVPGKQRDTLYGLHKDRPSWAILARNLRNLKQ
jgi:hypothetical protein